MANLFDTLGFNSDAVSDVIQLPASTIKQLNSTPQLITSWQKQDILDNNTDGYFVNPCANTCNTLWATANTLIGYTRSLTGTATTDLWTGIFNNLRSFAGYSVTTGGGEGDPPVTTYYPGEINKFIAHTNRISGVVKLNSTNASTANLPYYDSAIAIGKSTMYLTYQTDGRTDNAPLLGSFTSILASNTLIQISSNLSSYVNVISQSIHVNTTGSGGEGDPFVYTNVSNLSVSTVNNISSLANTLYSTILSRRVADETYFTNARNLANSTKTFRQFNNPGVTENYLIQNYVGSSKLKSRLSS